MVNIRENWADITGEVTYMRRDSAQPELQLVTVKIFSNKNYESFPNLIRPSEKNTITLHIKRKEIGELELKKGAKISTLVRAAPSSVYFPKMESLKILE